MVALAFILFFIVYSHTHTHTPCLISFPPTYFLFLCFGFLFLFLSPSLSLPLSLWHREGERWEKKERGTRWDEEEAERWEVKKDVMWTGRVEKSSTLGCTFRWSKEGLWDVGWPELVRRQMTARPENRGGHGPARLLLSSKENWCYGRDDRSLGLKTGRSFLKELEIKGIMELPKLMLLFFALFPKGKYLPSMSL